MAYCKTRKSALSRGSQFYKTGKPCARGHVTKRYTNTGRCYECAKINALSRYHMRNQQTPVWSDLVAIKEVYDKSDQMGSEYTVDHIIPLQGELVSGLHVPDNLEIVTKSENFSKQNKFRISDS